MTGGPRATAQSDQSMIENLNLLFLEGAGAPELYTYFLVRSSIAQLLGIRLSDHKLVRGIRQQLI